MSPRVTLASVLLASAAVAIAQADKDRKPGLTVLAVCEVLSNPLRYDGQFIQVRGRVDGTDEGAWLAGDDCPGVFVTNTNHVWPSSIFLSTPTSTTFGRTRIHEVDFEYDKASQLKVDPQYDRLRARLRDECIAWTYSGLFETRRDWSQAVATYPNGTTRIFGFGHLGQSPAQIILKSVDDVTAIANCKPKRGNRK